MVASSLLTSSGAPPFVVPCTSSPEMGCSILHHNHHPALTILLPWSRAKGIYCFTWSHLVPVQSVALQRAPFPVGPSPRPPSFTSWLIARLPALLLPFSSSPWNSRAFVGTHGQMGRRVSMCRPTLDAFLDGIICGKIGQIKPLLLWILPCHDIHVVKICLELRVLR